MKLQSITLFICCAIAILSTASLTSCQHKDQLQPATDGSKDLLIEWIDIPGGTFDMGSNHGDENEKPIHNVTIQDFVLAKHETTVAQYRQCVEAGACSLPDTKDDIYYCNWGYEDRDQHPINCVDWYQARQFCKWAGGRLPSESEWEFAARSGGHHNLYPWGFKKADCSLAIMNESGGYGCGKDRTWPVCSKPAGNTPSGLCDMAGNAWNWTEDYWNENYEGAPSDGSPWKEGHEHRRALRGGSWSNGNPSIFHTTFRIGFTPKDRHYYFSFRCAKDAED